MRVIGGTVKRKKLIMPKGKEFRLTTDKVKEAIFSAIQFEINEKTFLDLFAGSGQMGIEALSRGASSAIFIDNSQTAIKVIRSNLSIVGFIEQSKIIFNDAFPFLNNICENFDIAFLDPPFHSGIINKILPIIAQKINHNGIIICETSVKEALPEKYDNFLKMKSYHYGKIAVNIYRQQY
ncbi:MAG: 16S rRNA (guanine(966)-N(2))-methyltransferase RsmD [Oscillospiraceae bacterium]|jgi:16S rRNA (guanine(966)-N(2))-methyltransferase RsmD|nr:16S rRNA (guanine(966)-N(2))-methyltransferase RsmD [Oscillospiraceae bacterium]